jgi:hypothetical protein
MRRTNLKAVSTPKTTAHFHTLEAARDVAYWAHSLAASATAWKRGVDELDLADDVAGDNSQDSKLLAAETSLDALADRAEIVLEHLRKFREHDAAGD